MAQSMTGKVALVTGGSSGIGRATALVFAREGASVVIQDIDAAGGEETVAAIRELGAESIFAQGDVTNRDDVQSVVSQTVVSFGRLDYTFNNAASLEGYRSKIHEYDEDDWDHTIDVLLKGVWLGMKYQIRQMLEQGGGSIVITSSITGPNTAFPGWSHYGASKAGQLGFMRTACMELAKYGITVNAICPGYSNTALVQSQIGDQARTRGISEDEVLDKVMLEPAAIKRLVEPEEIARLALFLASDDGRSVTGAAMSIDAGWTAR